MTLSGEHLNAAGNRKAVASLRNNLPVLLSYGSVHFNFHFNHWIVELGSARSNQVVDLPLFIGQCPVYVHGRLQPEFSLVCYISDQRICFAYVDARKIADDRACEIVKKSFPASVGMRVHIYGWIEILYDSQRSLDKDMEEAEWFPNIIGDMHFDLKVVQVTITSDVAACEEQSVEVGDSVAPTPASRAVVAGVDYWWEPDSLSVKRSVIWRASGAGEDSAGGTLCVGDQAPNPCSAVMFQHYETRTMMRSTFWTLDWRRKLNAGCSFKGGFLLPEDVQNVIKVSRRTGGGYGRHNRLTPSGGGAKTLTTLFACDVSSSWSVVLHAYV